MPHTHTVGSVRYTFDTLADLLAKATPARSGDQLAGIAAESAQQRVAAQMALAGLPLSHFLDDPVVPYENDEVSRLILDTTRTPEAVAAFTPIASLTVGEFRDFLLSDDATPDRLATLAPALMPEIAAAVSKLMRLQDLVLVARKIHVVTRFRTTVGLPGRFSTRLQPNHPTDDPEGIAASILDGLLLGSGDAVIGINPVSDNVESTTTLLRLIDRARERFAIPTQSCVLAHITTQMQAIEQGAPLDLLFQSIGGTEATNTGFGVSLALLEEGHQMARALNRVPGANIMYFETGQGSSLSANAHHGVDQQTLEARAYAVARKFNPMLVNTVVGFIGPEYLYDGKQILRAGLEDHFCGKLLGLPMGCDICYTNHAEADQDDMDALLLMLGTAGVNYIMGVPGADDIMLNYQSTSFHDALTLRNLLNLRPAPEFEQWLESGRLPQLSVQAFAHRMIDLTRPGRTLRDLTPARVSLGRTGSSLTTVEVLDFSLSHAQARDAVQATLSLPTLLDELTHRNLNPIAVKSAAPDRPTYLRRPDLGRKLSEASTKRLRETPPANKPGLTFILADGLSALAVDRHAIPLIDALLPQLEEHFALTPAIIAEQARVALGDEIAPLLHAQLTIMLIGERPGLSSPDSLGAYITWDPRPGRTDAERNCVSNIRTQGLDYATAAAKIAYLCLAAQKLGLTGTQLKEAAPDPPRLLPRARHSLGLE